MPPPFTENGWPSCGPDKLDNTPVPGTNGQLVIPLQAGRPAIIMRAFAAAINKYVESLYNTAGYRDEGGWTPTNSVGTSNHLGGTAMDLNWQDHPMGPKVPDPAAGWQWSSIIGGPEEPMVRKLLGFFTWQGIQIIWWGNDWDSPHDSMHFQMGYNTYENPDILDDFIAHCIGPDGMIVGFDAPAPDSDSVALLAEAFENRAGVDYSRYTARYAQCLQTCSATTVPRIAMLTAQVGEESGGLQWQEELASGSEYEGRIDLGNTQPGDGPRFKGRDFIQITGRANYSKLSQWASDKGFVNSPTYFVDNPEQLASDTYAFLGVEWYWTVARPTLNDAADAQDVTTATKLVNGGTNGLADRQQRWQHCMDMGDRLLALTSGEDDWMTNPDVVAMITDIHRETVTQQSPSRSFMATDGNVVDTPLGIAWNTDANAWTLVMTEAYRLGVKLAVQVVEDIAKNGVNQTSWAGSQDFNAWLRDFGQQYCQGLVAEKKTKPVATEGNPNPVLRKPKKKAEKEG